MYFPQHLQWGNPKNVLKKNENPGESWSFHSTYKIIGGIHQFWRIHGTIVYLLTYYPKNSTKCIGTYNNKYTIHGSYENRFCHPTIQLHIAPQMMKKHAVIQAGSLLCFGTFRKIPRDLGTRLFHTDTCCGWWQIPQNNMGMMWWCFGKFARFENCFFQFEMSWWLTIHVHLILQQIASKNLSCYCSFGTFIHPKMLQLIVQLRCLARCSGAMFLLVVPWVSDKPNAGVVSWFGAILSIIQVK